MRVILSDTKRLALPSGQKVFSTSRKQDVSTEYSVVGGLWTVYRRA